MRQNKFAGFVVGVVLLCLAIIAVINFAPALMMDEEKQALRAIEQAQRDADKLTKQALERREKIARLEREWQNYVDDVIREIKYIQDPRTTPPICYAYYWTGGGDGGPALATVPCERIPPDLLIIAIVK